jgi:predicted permease
MIKNYLKTAFRNILKHKGFSIINITGLAIGMACTLLILLWVQDELSYDRFHKKGKDIYRVIQDITFTDHRTTWAITQGPLGPSLKKDFPEICNSTRITGRRFRLKFSEQTFDEIVLMADASIFEMFDFPLLKGDPTKVLSDPNAIVLTKKMAKKYFGEQNPLGKTITADNKHDFLVTGIVEECPKNSHIEFDFIIPFVFGRKLKYSVDRWNNSQFRTYVQLKKGTSAQDVIPKISNYLKEKPTIEKDAKLNLQALFRIHLYSDYEFDSAHGDITYVLIFSMVAFSILLIACFNFMNLTTARSGNRAREIGMRKVVGANKHNIIKQFFGESILLTCIGMIIALILVKLLLPVFNDLASKELSLELPGSVSILLGLLLITLLTGIISGSYPALYLSSFQPVKVLRGSSHSSVKGSRFRKILVVIQFSLTIILIICTTAVYKQLSFIGNKKLGYNREHMIFLGMRGELRKKFDAVKPELLKNPNILDITASSNVPTYGYSFSNSLWKWEGQNPDEELLMRAVFIDENYFKTFGIDIVEGRSFSKKFTTDEKEAIMVNEAAIKAMRLKSPLGKSLSIGDNHFKIIGVAKNYHFRSLHQKIDPLILIYSPQRSRVLFARLKSDKISQSIEHISQVWGTFAPGYPFKYYFLDESLDRLYRSDRRVGTILKYFSILAIIISCLGLFGLASFLAEQRTREIGIRKVLGASQPGIIILLSKEFAKWVLLANLVAWPLAYITMTSWLKNFAYQTNLGTLIFFLSALGALLIALLTVSYQAIRAANTNPVDALKHE